MGQSNNVVSAFVRTVDAISEWSGKLFGFIVPIMIGIVAYEVVLRYLFNAPTNWVNEASTMMFGAYFMLAGAYCIRHGFHAQADVFYRRFTTRQKAVINLFTSILFYSFIAVLIWEGSQAAWGSILVGERSTSTWSPPISPLRAVIPAAALLMVLQGLANSIRDVKTAMGRTDKS